jgi:CRP-like cAMP-binding protein
MNKVDLSPLDAVGWLAEQPEEFRDWAAGAGRWSVYAAGRFLYHAGDAPEGLFGLAKGTLEVTFPLLAEEPVAIHRTEMGFWIGDNALLSETPRLVSVVAATDSRVFRIPAAAVKRLLADRPEHWRAFYRLNARNLELAVRSLSEALALTVRARVCRRLLALSDPAGVAPITQPDLAKLIGVTRATLQRCLADLAEKGGIRRGYGAVEVVDRAVLERFVDEQ